MTRPGSEPRLSRTALIFGLIVAWSGRSVAADVEAGRDLFRAGRYDEAAALADEEIGRKTRDERWYALKVEADLARGRTEAAVGAVEEAVGRFPASVTLRLLGRDVYRGAGRADDAAALLASIEALARDDPGRYATPEGRIALGRTFLLRGADARKVLDGFFDVVTRLRPDHVDGFLATARLAMEKQDHALAASTLEKAPKDAARDPEYHYLIALAFADDDRPRSAKALDEALKLNPRHVDSLLLRADGLIDSERQAEAAEALARAIEVNPREPRAWAYRAVLAHLKSDPAGEASARAEALASWPRNPEVDHLIGRKLSGRYRFAEGAAAQRRALGLDPTYRPAKVQLCQDLLRLGDEDEGWRLADEVFAEDGYNVVAFNLVTLRDRLKGFRTLRDDGLIVRMDPREADLYGRRVVDLLRRARATLSARYGVTLDAPVIVEVFPRKNEFAVRTFGLPGADGFLGVCFGRVVTANSPASQGEHPSNWEAVLWHEFCHAVTLHKTRNKMPRWLSEGISVYEEGRERTSWVAPLGRRERDLILGDGLTPLSRLSSAFLSPKTPGDLQFAYVESALAVAFLVDRAGPEALNGLLDDLGAGRPLDEALPARARMTLEEMDRAFAGYARARAEAVAPGASWDEPDVPPGADRVDLAAWSKAHPRSVPGLRRLGARLVAESDWPGAKVALESLRSLHPTDVGPEGCHVLLAKVYRALADPAAERSSLQTLVSVDADASAALLRLIEIDEAARDWPALARDARDLLAVNPLIAAPHRALAHASDALGDLAGAIDGYQALAILDETDPAELHYRLASLLHRAGRASEARREVLRSLEEAPRFRAAQSLLLQIVGPAPIPPPAAPGAPTP